MKKQSLLLLSLSIILLGGCCHKHFNKAQHKKHKQSLKNIKIENSTYPF